MNINDLILNVFSDPLEFGEDSLSMFCKTKAVDCLSEFNYNGKTYDTCTSDSIDKSDKKEEFFWCATEVDEKNEMVRWGVCDLSTCKYNISCLFTNASIY